MLLLFTAMAPTRERNRSK
jgi:hypothetical protein